MSLPVENAGGILGLHALIHGDDGFDLLVSFGLLVLGTSIHPPLDILQFIDAAVEFALCRLQQALAQVDFSVSLIDGTAPLLGLPTDRYSARWTGSLRPMFSEDYTFFLVTDEGVRLWVNDELLVDRWNPGAQIDFEAPGLPIFLRAGQFYDLRVEFQNVVGDGWVELKWESDSQPREIVPAARLYQPIETAPPAP